MSVNKKEYSQKSSNDVLLLVERKIDFFKDIMQKTIIHIQKSKNLNILGISDVNLCIEKLSEISKKIEDISIIKNITTDNIINNLQLINNELSGILKTYGTENLEDLLLICFGNNNKITNNDIENHKFEILKKYFHPTSYKVISKLEDKNEEKKNNLDCYDISQQYKQFHMKVYGIKVYIQSLPLKKTLLVNGLVDDVIIDFLHNKFIDNKLNE